MSKNYNKIILELSRKYAGTKYVDLVEKATDAYVVDDYKKLDKIIASFPTDIELLETLIRKLEGKSVYTNLKRVLEGKETSIEQELLSTASLIVHVGIEIKENKEYKCLLPDLYKKLGVIINKI